jgi:hypothetical protein
VNLLDVPRFSTPLYDISRSLVLVLSSKFSFLILEAYWRSNKITGTTKNPSKLHLIFETKTFKLKATPAA